MKTLPSLVVCLPQVTMYFGNVWPDANSPFIATDSILQPALHLKGNPQVVVRLYIVGFKRKSPLITGDS